MVEFSTIGITDRSNGIMNTGTGGLAELLKSLLVALAANRNGGYNRLINKESLSHEAEKGHRNWGLIEELKPSLE